MLRSMVGCGRGVCVRANIEIEPRSEGCAEATRFWQRTGPATDVSSALSFKIVSVRISLVFQR